MIKVVFFDTSDTLYSNKDFEKAQSKQPIYLLSEKKNISFAEGERLFKDKKEDLKNKLDHVTKVAVMMEFGFSRLEMQENMARIDAHDFLSSDEKLSSMIKNLSKNYKLGIISNILKKAVKNVLEVLNVSEEYFDFLVTVDNTSKSKPNRDPFLKAIELANIDPSEIVYIGDSLTKDIIPAKKEGLRTIWITGKKESSKYADAIVKNIYEIPEIIRNF